MSDNEVKPRTVYKLCRTDKAEDDGTGIYVGSTSQPLWKRLCEHRSAAKINDSKLYKRIREVGIYKWEIIPLLTFTCDKKKFVNWRCAWSMRYTPT